MNDEINHDEPPKRLYNKGYERSTDKTTRPKKPIDWRQFEELCGLLCTQDEIAGVLRVAKNTLIARVEEHYQQKFVEVYNYFAAPAKRSLRRYQFQMAEKHPNMAIWLGKQWLGQKDQVNTTYTCIDDENEIIQE